MSDGNQLALSLDPGVRKDAKAIRLVFGGVARKDPKRLASLAGRKDEKTLHAAVDERDRNKLGIEDLVAGLKEDERQEIIRTLCEIAGGEFKPREKFTPAEKYERLVRRLGRYLSPKVIARLVDYAEGKRR